MALIEETISGLYGGVSSQTPSLRLKNQCEAQENAIGSLIHGLHKRPPLEYKAVLPDEISEHCYIHKIQRDTSEQYLVYFTDNTINPIIVWDKINNVQKTVHYGKFSPVVDAQSFSPDTSVKSYLTNAPEGYEKAIKRIRAATIADYTIIINRSVTPFMDPGSETDALLNNTYVSVNSWREDNVVITLDGEQQTVSVGNTWAPDHVAETIKTTLEDPAKFSNPPTVEINGSFLKVYYSDNRSFDLSVSGTDVVVSSASVCDSYSDLFPATIFPEVTLQILKDSYGESAPYYVTSHEGKWEECPGPGVLTKFSSQSMPHMLVRLSDGDFYFAPCLWEAKGVGDDKTAPDPSFIEKNIEDVFFHSNRLGFLSKTSVVMSRPGYYFDFYPSTALEILDDDPIDVGIATKGVVTLREALPFNKNLLLRADNNQFILSYSGNVLSPKTVSVDLTTNYVTIADSFSTQAGPNLYFVCPNQDFVTIREYYVQPQTFINDALDISKQIPNYIPKGDYFFMESVPQMGFIFVFSKATPTDLYVYHYTWNGTERIQGAWGKWIFPYNILGVTAFGPDLYITLQVGTTPVLLTMSLNGTPSTSINLDMKVSLSGTYDSATDTTTFTLPWEAQSADWHMVNPDTKLEVFTIMATVGSPLLTISGDYSGKEYLFGLNYCMKWEPTKWLIKDQKNNVVVGDLRLRGVTIHFWNTGYFIVEVIPKNRTPYQHEYTGEPLSTALLGQANFQTNRKRFMVLGKTEDIRLIIKNDTHFPTIIQGITYEGFFTAHSQNI